MDKETLSNYGWVVICTLVIAIMIALATPFGEYISAGVWSTTNGLNDTLNKNMEIAGLSGSGDNTPDEPEVNGLQFGQKYIVTSCDEYELIGSYYILYEDGSAIAYFYGEENTIPAGWFVYTETEILPGGSDETSVKILENGKKLAPTGADNMIFTLESEIHGAYFNKKYVVTTHPDSSWIGAYIVFNEDGSASQHRTDGTVDYFPSDYFTYEKTQIVYSGDSTVIVFKIIDDGNKIYSENDGAAIIAVLES